MEWLCNARLARVAVAMMALVTIAGCPELNQWSGPSQDPFFSVPDPPPASWGAEGGERLDDPSLPDETSGD
jgi:hypothetical protein